METFSNQHFETWVSRGLNFLIYKFNQQIEKSRDKEFSKQFYRQEWASIYEKFDECSELIAKNFDEQYKLGDSILEIIQHSKRIVEQNDPMHDQKNRGQLERIHYRRYKLLNIDLPKIDTVTNQSGHVVAQNTYSYNINWKAIKRIWKVKSEEELMEVFFEIATINYIVCPKFELGYSLVKYENFDDLSIFKALVKYRCAQLFREHLLTQQVNPEIEQDLLPIAETLDKTTKSNEVWTRPKTEFYKLVYALHHTGYIKGEITRIMEKLAPSFGLSLAKSWQSSASKNMDYSNAGYNSTEMFDELKKGFIQHVEERENNKKK